ncbi:uncharacterized protein ABDE67_020693 [Symphorus nematophorus]
MDRLQVSFVCLLLKMITFDPIDAQLPRCRRCPQGYFVIKNCSVIDGGMSGVQCERCTDCSAADQDTLAECSAFADSLCRNKTIHAVQSTAAVPWTRTAEAAVSAPDGWVVLTVIVVSLFLVLLISLFLVLLSCRQRQPDKLQGLDPL